VAQLRYSHAARQDLIDIWGFIGQNSPATADRVIDRVMEACQSLERFPGLGRARPEISVDARSLSVERWLVLYRQDQGKVHILRILDAARDLDRVRL